MAHVGWSFCLLYRKVGAPRLVEILGRGRPIEMERILLPLKGVILGFYGKILKRVLEKVNVTNLVGISFGRVL
jgi:hypothetical protein